MPEVTLIRGDATERWPLEDNSLDSIVTDPPYGIAFMGKAWDDKGGPLAYQQWTGQWAAEAYRCLKPGGFLLAFGATRMAHRMTCGFEDVGFEILDTIEWLYLSGMPKAQDIGKMFDQRAGVKREVVGRYVPPNGKEWNLRNDISIPGDSGKTMGKFDRRSESMNITAPATDLAKQWDGWKTPSLKPAHEPIVVARKPIIGTYCENIERWGVGAINVDACRVPSVGGGDNREGEESAQRRYTDRGRTDFAMLPGPRGGDAKGRFPANVVMSHAPGCTDEACMEGCPVAVLDAQSGITKSSGGRIGKKDPGTIYGGGKGWAADFEKGDPGYGDVGGASKVFAKFFYEEDDFVGFRYCPKAGDKDRNAGCEDLPNGNDHATVKPTALIRYLLRLVTPRGGRPGSPFLGSGTDAVAAILEGFDFWGMNLPDRTGEEYWPIIEAKVAHALKAAENGTPQQKKTPKEQPKTTEAAPPIDGQMRLFDLMTEEGQNVGYS